MLQLAGENKDKHCASYGVEQGRLVRIMRGVLVEAGDDSDAVILNHAIRIARYLYPRTYLSGCSAEKLSPTIGGRLFLSGKRGQRTRLRSLEIIQARAPDRPEIETVTLSDSLGDISVQRATTRFRFPESFRVKSESGAAIDENIKL